MQVRYQAAPRPDTISFSRVRADPGRPARGRDDTPFCRRCLPSATQNLHQLLELDANLLDDLLALRHVHARFLARELISGAADGETLVVQEAADLADDEHVLALVVTAVAATLDWLELRELLLPIAQD